MKLPNKTIKEIAEYLDCGMICYVHKKTKEVRSIVDPNNLYADEELWREDLDEVENNWDSYIKIEKMSSREAFQVMEAFTEQVINRRIRERLVYALSRNKPFHNFKNEVDYDEAIRQQWFRFKANKYEEWVKLYFKPIKEENIKETQIGMAYYNDDGTEHNPDLYPLPSLCMSCKKKDDPNEEIICNLTRMDQLGNSEFICHAYAKN